MKKSNIRFYQFIMLFLAFGSGTATMAQTADEGLSVAGQSLLKGQRLWLQTGNAAGTAHDNTRNYSRLQVNYDVQSGDFHRVYTGKTVRDANIYTEGFVNLGKAYVWGELKFTHENVGNARFNASINDPYRGQPYFVVDSGVQSKWRNQNYHLRFRAATPVLFRSWTFGLEGTYKAQLAAKQRDPRVDARFFMLQLMPGVTYSPTYNDVIGVNLCYASVKEESNMELENYQVKPHYFELYGLGTAHRGIGTGRETNYFGNRWGFGLQYEHHMKGWKLLAELTADKYVENNEISFTTPKKDSQLEEKNLGANIQAMLWGRSLTHQVRIGFNRRAVNGIMYLSQNDNTQEKAGWKVLHQDIRSTYKTTDLSAAYTLLRPRDTEYSWRSDLSVAYQKLDDKYLLPLSVKNSENIYLRLNLERNIIVGRSMNRRLLLAVGGMWKDALRGEYRYTGANANLVTVREMEPLDQAYLTADAWGANGAITYSQLLKSQSKVNGFAQLAFDYAHTNAAMFNHRSRVNVTLGVNF